MEIIEGYNGKYELHLVSGNGQPRVWSVYKKKYLKSWKDKDGYNMVTLYYAKGKKRHEKMSRLVALNFINNPTNYPLVDHIKNNDDDRIQNLRWADFEINNVNRRDVIGCYYDKKHNYWLPQFRGKTLSGGKETKEEAMDIYQKARDEWMKQKLNHDSQT